MAFRTEQEKFWAGDFGNEYVRRNRGGELNASSLAMFSRILSSTRRVSSVVEFGANIGINLLGIRQLLPEAELSAVEINENAAEQLRNIKGISVYQQSILDFSPEKEFDFVLTRGVLIHINPHELTTVYDTMHRFSRRYICIAEYYNPVPMEIDYRGHAGRLFKRDFAGEMLDRHPDLRLIDYSFVYHRDPNFPQDDITWFLLEKPN